jgi:RNA polymerase sigma factor (sigma-70 family)
MTKNLRIEARVRNNILWHAIFDNYESVADFCRKHKRIKLTGSIVGSLLNLAFHPLKKNSKEYKDICIKISKAVKIIPEDLFPIELYGKKETKTVIETSFTDMIESGVDIKQIEAPDSTVDSAMDDEMKEEVHRALKTIDPRSSKILMMRMEGETLKDIANIYKISSDRVRQIEAKGLMMLRHPYRYGRLQEFLNIKNNPSSEA